MRNLKKAVLVTAASLAVLVPAAFATQTTLTINANVEQYVVLQIERDVARVIASKDDADPMPGSPATNQVLNFGNIDPLAISAGTLTGTPTAAAGSLDKELLVGTTLRDETTFNVSTMAPTDGAAYFVNGTYRLRGLRNDGSNVMNVDVQAVGTLDAIVSLDADNAFGHASTLNGRRVVGAAPSSLIPAMAVDTATVIDLGIVVPINVTPGAQSTVITFFGT